MSFQKRLKRQLVWSVAGLFIWLLNVVPRSIAVGLGSWIGLVAWAIIPKDRYKINRHLKLIYGDKLSDTERRLIGRTFFINSGKNLVEIVRFRKHFATEIKPLVTVEGLEHFDKAYREGKGLVGVTGHIGNFELLAAHIASLGYEIGVIGREMSDPRINHWLVENRKAVGLTNFATTSSPRELLLWLKAGKALGVLIDTDSMRVRGEFLPAFGRLSNTPVGQTLLGLRTGAAFVPLACVRTADNRYKIIIRPAINYCATDPEDELVRSVTTKSTKVLEEIIDSHKDQWIWLHNRWHTRPTEQS